MSEVDRWRDSLTRLVRNCSADHMSRMVVLKEVDSTQDEAKRTSATHGTVITTLRQRRGRGRHGRAWADSDHSGIALSIVVGTGDGTQPMLAATCAACDCIDSYLPRGGRAWIKWPNDVIVNRRKAAGILTEICDDVTIVGVGINVGQTAWSPELEQKAISLAQAGATRLDRLDVVSRFLTAMDARLADTVETLAAEIGRRNALQDARVRLSCKGAETEGRVVAFDPLGTLEIEDEAGVPHSFPASQVTIQAAFGPRIDLKD